MLRIALTCCVCWMLMSGGYAQHRHQQSPGGVRIGLSLDAIHYQGDYAERGQSSFRTSVGSHLTLTPSRQAVIAPVFHLGIGNFAEQFDLEHDAPEGMPNFVQTRIVYGDLGLMLRPFRLGKWQPFVSVAAGLIHFRPKDMDGRNLMPRLHTRDVSEADYNALIPQLPLQAGLLFEVTARVSVGMTYQYRFVPTDYLDNAGEWGSRQGFDALHALSMHVQLDLGHHPVELPTKDPESETELLPANEWISQQP